MYFRFGGRHLGINVMVCSFSIFTTAMGKLLPGSKGLVVGILLISGLEVEIN